LGCADAWWLVHVYAPRASVPFAIAVAERVALPLPEQAIWSVTWRP
jgi:hypothetical protein